MRPITPQSPTAVAEERTGTPLQPTAVRRGALAAAPRRARQGPARADDVIPAGRTPGTGEVRDRVADAGHSTQDSTGTSRQNLRGTTDPD
ncbi:hypothetical protein ACFVT1_13430 [Streptomyces sp. NPDC057963]|uniref:hypothetical protein n=1 Tax=Streptomyces sp. NPDC057963 TaxID=3346290 RepID=UPI0036F121F4